MGSQTPLFAIPYPLGTDRVMDGDDAMHALAQRVEDRVGGCIACVRGPATQSDIGATATAILSVSATFKAGHRYRLSASSGNAQVSAAAPTCYASLRVDGTELIRLYSFSNQPASTTVTGGVSILYLPTVDATSVVAIYLLSNGGAVRTNINQSSIFVDDLGAW